jgi:hypothetical protein
VKLTLEQELEIEKIKMYLKAHPEKAVELAKESYRSFILQRSAYQQLKKKYQEALECLRIHASDDAGAREIVQKAKSTTKPSLPRF